MSFLDEAKKIVGTALTVWDQIEPFIEPLEAAVPAFADVTEKVEDFISKGEMAADDLIDNHRTQISVVADFSLAMGEAFMSLNRFCLITLDAASLNDDTPEEVTLSEAAEIFEAGKTVALNFKAAYDTIGAAKAALADLKAMNG